MGDESARAHVRVIGRVQGVGFRYWTADEAQRRHLSGWVRNLDSGAVVFVGLTIYQQIFGRDATPGAGAKPERFGGAPIFVVPNPSGLNASFPGFQHKLVWFEALRQWLDDD